MALIDVGRRTATQADHRRVVTVLMPDPRRVRALLARYASARIALEEKSTLAWQQELEDVTYTLCVLTGARSIAEAIAAADGILERHVRGQHEVSAETAGEDTALAA